MPPKASKAKQAATKAAKVEDKTFGLKNKNKSAKVRQFVTQVQDQSKNTQNKDRDALEAHKRQLEASKKAAEKEFQDLYKSAIVQPKVPFGVDPKTVLCAFYKAGQCLKKEKCKYSHDLNVERKVGKANLYQDARDVEKQTDTIDKWDQDKLETAVREKENVDGRENLNKETEIVCKYFIAAIDDRSYGWFWDCPNGLGCKYRHALPPGFILKKKETDEEKKIRIENERDSALTIEDFLEVERHKLGSNLTPVTSDSFAKWRNERNKREQELEVVELKKKAEDFKKMKAGMKTGVVFSGKDLFDFNPEWAVDADDDGDAMDEYIIAGSDCGDNDNEADDTEE